MSSFLDGYLHHTNMSAPGINNIIHKVAGEFKNKALSDLSYNSRKTGLVFGRVQSGKTASILGIIATSADQGFNIFIMLTSDNIYLYGQTLKRSMEALDGIFCVCGETDYVRFLSNNFRRPVLIVLKKNVRKLNSWKKHLARAGICEGNLLVLIDDEGDSYSLNTKINQSQVSTINNAITKIRNLFSGALYIQLTATPQALFLQSPDSDYRPNFYQIIPSGEGYLGGDFFFSEVKKDDIIRFTPENSINDLIDVEDTPINSGLEQALCSFLVATAHLFLTNQCKVSNFLIHPSIKTSEHERTASDVCSLLNELSEELTEGGATPLLEEAWKDLQSTQPDLLDYDTIRNFLTNQLEIEAVKIHTMNVKSKVDSNLYSSGINILVGGTSVSRGVTFPSLTTLYYTRQSKKPSADSYWQHCRIFGYDRHPEVMRLYMPKLLYKMFCDLNQTNEAIIKITERNQTNNVKMLYPQHIIPTRKNVVDQSLYSCVIGGRNFFPFEPVNNTVDRIDSLLERFDSDTKMYQVHMDLISDLLACVSSVIEEDWPAKIYADCVKCYKDQNPSEPGVLIVRRERDIKKGTGTLLSPDDRALGMEFPDKIVLTMYRLTGTKEKGWDGNPLWVPNIKFPEGYVFNGLIELATASTLA